MAADQRTRPLSVRLVGKDDPEFHDEEPPPPPKLEKKFGMFDRDRSPGRKGRTRDASINRSTGELLKGEMETDGKLTRIVVVGNVLAVTLGNWLANAQDVNSPANPFTVVENWATLPTERAWDQVIGVEIDPDGKSVWVLDRGGPKGCMDPIGATINPIQKFDRNSKLIISFGASLFNWPYESRRCR
jgi:hypothetical protein